MIDAYELLKQGKSIDEINEIIAAELNAANTKIAEEEEAAAAEAKKEAYIKETREAAVAALTEYFALVNPNVTEKIISSVLDTLESVKITVKPERGIRSKTSVFDDWADIMNLLLR